MNTDFDIGYLPRKPINSILDDVVLAEEAGFDGIWFADSQSVFREVTACLTAAALRTERMLLASGVSNPITRHPAVLASGMASLDELSDGRALLGIGRGESAVATVGESPSSLDETEEYIRVLRDLMAGESVDYQGNEIKITWSDRRVPVHLASSGPKSLQRAGRVADGVLFQVGAREQLIEYGLKNIRAGARESGRTLGDLELCLRLGCNVRRDRETARDAMKSYASVAAGTIHQAVPSRELPEQLREDLRRMKEEYDYYEHADEQARHRELVTDRILDSVSVAGTPGDVIERLESILDYEEIDRVVLALPDVDTADFVETFSETVLPTLRSR